jgi:type IV pilus assembly protein PilV
MNMHRQHGMFLIEALISILIFSLGVLGMIAMSGKAVSAQSDAQFRTEASNMADEIAGQIAIRVNRTGATPAAIAANIAASLPAFEHQTTSGAYCTFSGAVAPDPFIQGLVEQAGNLPAGTVGLPGAGIAQQQILVDTATHNQVTITLCWQTASDVQMRRHTLVTYVN